MPDARYLSAADALAPWREDLLAGTPPQLYPVGTGELARLEIGPGLVSLIGGAPGTGKTALVMQGVLDALRLTPTLRVVVCNVEMSPAVLLERQLARLSGIDLSLIRHRRLTAEHAERIDLGLATIEALGDRPTRIADLLLANVELDLAAPIAQVEEDQLSRIAQ